MKNYIISILVLASAFLIQMKNPVSAQEGELKFAITGAVASDPSFTSYRELTAYVANKMREKPLFVSGLSYGQVDNLFTGGMVDVGFLCNAHYARRKDAVKFEPIVAPVIAAYGKPKFRVYLIVHKDSSIKSLDDLRGKSVDLADPLSTTSIYTAHELQKKNETMKSYFGKTVYSGSHDMTIKLVAGKLVDAGFIDGHIWDYHERFHPLDSSKTKVIARSTDFTTPPVVVSKMMDEASKKKIRRIFLDMNKDPKGREILNKLGIEKFKEIKDKDYQDVFHMYTGVKGHL